MVKGWSFILHQTRHQHTRCSGRLSGRRAGDRLHLLFFLHSQVILGFWSTRCVGERCIYCFFCSYTGSGGKLYTIGNLNLELLKEATALIERPD